MICGDLFNLFEFPLLLTNENGRIFAVNHKAKQWISEGKVLIVTGQNLSISGMRDPQKWRSALRQATLSTPPQPALLGDLPPGNALIVIKPACTPDRRLALVACLSNTGASQPLNGLLANQFGLTKRECEIASLISDGLSAEVISLRLSLKTNTIRTHIKHIFMKTGVKNQTELASCLQPLKLFF